MTASNDFPPALTPPLLRVRVYDNLLRVGSSQGHNIFANLCSKEYSSMMQLLKQAILSTDLTLHFE